MKELTFETNRNGCTYTVVRINALPKGSLEVPGFDGYWATRDGHVYTYEDKTGMWRQCNEIHSINASGLYYTDINMRSSYESRKMTRCRLHRVIARVFLSDKFTIGYVKGSKIYINHIDGDTAHNNVSNLEVVTASQNSLHAIKTLHKNFGMPSVSIKLIDISTDAIAERYDSISDWMRAYNIHNPGTANGYIKNHLKFHNKFYVEYETERTGE